MVPRWVGLGVDHPAGHDDDRASPVAQPLLEAVDVLRSDGTARPTGFLGPNSKWSRPAARPGRCSASGRRRCCSTCATPSAPATSGWARSRRLRRYPEDAAVGSRRPGCRPQPAGPGQSARLARRAPVRRPRSAAVLVFVAAAPAVRVRGRRRARSRTLLDIGAAPASSAALAPDHEAVGNWARSQGSATAAITCQGASAAGGGFRRSKALPTASRRRVNTDPKANEDGEPVPEPFHAALQLRPITIS